MTPYRVRYTPAVAESIRHLRPAIKQAIREGIRTLSADPLRGHALVLEIAGFRSFRVSRYRVVYRLREEDRTVETHLVGPRKDIYEVFRELLEQGPRG
jgi:mRNA interferase RelE/StbE